MPNDYDDNEPLGSSLEEVCERLDRIEEDVCDRLDRVEKAIKENHWSPVSVAVTFFAIAVIWALPDIGSAMWYSKARYEWSYDISSNQVTIDKRPKDCDFFHAPIGDKACKYKRQVSSIRVRTDSSDLARGPIREVSYDDGATWSVDTSVPPTQPQVLISWEKVEDQ